MTSIESLPLWLLAILGLMVAILIAAILFAGAVYLATGGRNLNPQPANNPGANNLPAAGNRGWNMTRASTAALVGALVIGVAFFGVLLIRMYHYEWSPYALWTNEPIWFYILGIAIAIFALSRINAGSVSISFSAGSFAMRVLTNFLVLSAFFFLLSKIFPSAPLFNGAEGYGHIAWYYILAFLGAMVAAHLTKYERFVNIALVVLMFALLGHETGRLLDPSGKLFANVPFFGSGSGGGNSGGQQSATVTGTTCDGNLTDTITLSGSPTLLTTGTSCQMLFNVLVGQVRVEGAGGYMDFDPSGLIRHSTPPGWRGITIRSIQSGTQIVRRYCPPNTTQWDGNRCI